LVCKDECSDEMRKEICNGLVERRCRSAICIGSQSEKWVHSFEFSANDLSPDFEVVVTTNGGARLELDLVQVCLAAEEIDNCAFHNYLVLVLGHADLVDISSKVQTAADEYFAN
jgi:hypothetical protein